MNPLRAPTGRTTTVLLIALWLFISTDDSSAEFEAHLEALSDRIDSVLREGTIPGAAVALVSADSILWLKCFGVLSIASGTPVTEDSHFRVGSCTKSLIGLGILKLIQEGRIDVNRPVKEIVPEIEVVNQWADTHPVRVIHLLEHTAGFDDTHLSSLFYYDGTVVPLVQAIEARPSLFRVRWPPGSRYAYSSPGYTLAAYIIEKVTNLKYEDYLREEILEPIGMVSAALRPTPEALQHLGDSYDEKNARVPLVWCLDPPAAALSTSVYEMALFVKFLLNRGRTGSDIMIDAELMDRLGQPASSIAARAGLQDGYSFGVNTWYRNGRKWRGHDGAIPGYIAEYACTHQLGVGYVVLLNKLAPVEYEEICDLVRDYLAPATEPPVIIPLEIPASELETYTGYYEYRSSRQQLFMFLDILLAGTVISYDNDTLSQQNFMEAKFPLIPVSSDKFRKRNQPDASRVFTTTADGTRLLVTMGSYYEKTGSWKPLVYRSAFVLAITLMLSSVCYALFWIPVHVYKRLRKRGNVARYIKMRIFPLCAVLSLIISIMALASQTVMEMGQPTLNNKVYFGLSITFAIFSLLSLISAVASFRKPVRVLARIYGLAVSLACFGMTIYLGYWGIIGLRMWAD